MLRTSDSDGARPPEAEQRRHGLTAPAMGLPLVPRWLGRLVMRVFATPEAQARSCEKLVRSSSALMLFAAESHERRTWVDIGRSFERVALAATALGIRHAHVNMPCEVVEVRRELRRHLGLGAEPLLLVRIGYAPEMPRAPRRPLEQVVSWEPER